LAGSLLAAVIGTPVARGTDIVWIGANGGNWGENTNWPIDQPSQMFFGEPLADFGERAVINNATTAIVNGPFNTPTTDTGGILLGVSGSTGGLTIQNGGNLNSRLSDVQLDQQTSGIVEIGRAGRGFLTIEGGGTLTAEGILMGGPTTPVATQSKITLGGTSGLTATLTSNGVTSLRRTTQITGPNVNFTSKGPLTLSDAHTLIADITGATHSPIKATVSPITPTTTNATGHAYVDGTLKMQFAAGVSRALGTSWNIIDANTIHGDFSSIDATAVAPALPAGQAFQTRVRNGGANGKLLQVAVEQMLTLQVNRQTGAVAIRNTAGAAGGLNDVSITGYQIESQFSSLNGGGWNSLTDQATAGWQETTPSATSVGELKSTAGGTNIAGATSRALGTLFSQQFPAFGVDPDSDVSFSYTTSDGVRNGLIELQGTKVFNNLIVHVDPTTGAAQLRNDSPHTIAIEGYSLFSPSNQLLPGTWNSLDDQNVSPNVFESAPTAGVLSELVTVDAITLTGFQTFSLGNLFTPGGTQNLTFEFLLEDGADAVPGAVSYGAPIVPGNDADFDNDSDVDGRDFLTWQRGFGVGTTNAAGDADNNNVVNGADLTIWRQKFGLPAAAGAVGAVPEPSTMLLSVLAGGLFWRRSRRLNDDAVECTPVRGMNEMHQGSKQNMTQSQARSGLTAAVAGLLALCAAIVASPSADAADLLVVARPAEFDAPDDQLITLLKSFGHTIVNEGDVAANRADFRAAPPTAAELAGVDAIVISRANNSGNYDDDAAEIAGWNAITKPIVSMNPQLARGGHATNGNNRWGWVNMEATTTTDNTAAVTDYDPFPNPAHPFVAGRSTDVFFLGETIDYLNRDSTKYPAGSTTVANMTIAAASFAAIVDIPAGSTLFTNGQGVVDPLLGRRVLLQMIEYPDTHDVFQITTNGGQILNQIINSVTLTAASMPAGDVDGNGAVNIADFNLIRDNFGTTVTNRNLGDLTGDSFVDLEDYRLWKAVAAPADVAAAIIPEPAGLALATIAVAAAALRRRHTSRNRGDASQRLHVHQRPLRRHVSLCLALVTLSCLAVSQARAANIAWVSFHSAENAPSQGALDNGFTAATGAPDIGYTQLLTAAGHAVTRFVTVNDVQNTTLGASLNTFDLVIIGRSVDSGHYQTDAETAVWNTTITKPMIMMSGYINRNSRLGFMDAETIPDTSGPVKLKAANPGHPIFAGIALDGAGTMVNDFTTGVPTHPATGAPQRGISVNTGVLDAGGTLLATVDTAGDAGNGGIVIAEWNAGAVITNVNTNTTDTLGGRRMMFHSGSREQAATPNSSQMSGLFDLTATGQQLFRNAVAYMAGPGLQSGDVNGDGDVDMDDFQVIRNNFQKTVAGRTAGDLTGDTLVDWKDFRQWKDFFPFTPPPTTAAAESVPEPASALLGLFGAGAFLGLSRSIRRCS
jgi:hypothetical protein